LRKKFGKGRRETGRKNNERGRGKVSKNEK
jgi:hypothetical protein